MHSYEKAKNKEIGYKGQKPRIFFTICHFIDFCLCESIYNQDTYGTMNECIILGSVTVCVTNHPSMTSMFYLTFYHLLTAEREQRESSQQEHALWNSSEWILWASYDTFQLGTSWYGWYVLLSWVCGQTALILILILWYMQHNVVIKTNCSRPRLIVQREHVPLFTSVRMVAWRLAFEVPWARVLVCHLFNVFLSVIVQFFFF